jgi:hypothetical protein
MSLHSQMPEPIPEETAAPAQACWRSQTEAASATRPDAEEAYNANHDPASDVSLCSAASDTVTWGMYPSFLTLHGGKAPWVLRQRMWQPTALAPEGVAPADVDVWTPSPGECDL